MRNGDREVGFVVERSVVALEAKLSPLVRDGDVKHLVWLRDQLGQRLKGAANLTTGPDGYPRAATASPPFRPS